MSSQSQRRDFPNDLTIPNLDLSSNSIAHHVPFEICLPVEMIAPPITTPFRSLTLLAQNKVQLITTFCSY